MEAEDPAVGAVELVALIDWQTLDQSGFVPSPRRVGSLVVKRLEARPSGSGLAVAVGEVRPSVVPLELADLHANRATRVGVVVVMHGVEPVSIAFGGSGGLLANDMRG
jgi:hypothetical protein